MTGTEFWDRITDLFESAEESFSGTLENDQGKINTETEREGDDE